MYLLLIFLLLFFLSSSEDMFIDFLKRYIFFFFYWFQREGKGGRKWGRKTSMSERNIDWLHLANSPSRDQTCIPGVCPDVKSNLRTFGLWDAAHPTEPYLPGLTFFRGGRWEGERWDGKPISCLSYAPNQEPTCNLGMFPSWELNTWPFSLWD